MTNSVRWSKKGQFNTKCLYSVDFNWLCRHKRRFMLAFCGCCAWPTILLKTFDSVGDSVNRNVRGLFFFRVRLSSRQLAIRPRTFLCYFGPLSVRRSVAIWTVLCSSNVQILCILLTLLGDLSEWLELLPVKGWSEVRFYLWPEIESVESHQFCDQFCSLV